MKEKHSDEFKPPEELKPKEDFSSKSAEMRRGSPSDKDAGYSSGNGVPQELLAAMPPGLAAYLPLANKYIDSRVQAALEAERPQIVAAVKGTIERVLAEARAAGVSVPGVPSGPGEGGAIPGSPVTPQGLAWINLLRGGGGGESESLDGFIRKAGQFKAIGELFNPPPSITERIMQTAYIRSLKNVGLVTDKQMKDVEKSLLGEIEE